MQKRSCRTVQACAVESWDKPTGLQDGLGAAKSINLNIPSVDGFRRAQSILRCPASFL